MNTVGMERLGHPECLHNTEHTVSRGLHISHTAYGLLVHKGTGPYSKLQWPTFIDVLKRYIWYCTYFGLEPAVQLVLVQAVRRNVPNVCRGEREGGGGYGKQTNTRNLSPCLW